MGNNLHANITFKWNKQPNGAELRKLHDLGCKYGFEDSFFKLGKSDIVSLRKKRVFNEVKQVKLEVIFLLKIMFFIIFQRKKGLFVPRLQLPPHTETGWWAALEEVNHILPFVLEHCDSFFLWFEGYKWVAG